MVEMIGSNPVETKTVTFSDESIKIRYMVTWSFAHRQARSGEVYLRDARDRARFRRRIDIMDWIISPIIEQKIKIYKSGLVISM